MTKPRVRRDETPWVRTSLAHFPRHINTIFVLMIRVLTLREGGYLLGFSFLKLCSIF